MNTVESQHLDICRGKTSKGKACSRHVAAGQKTCWQHTTGWSAKYKSLTRNQSILFFATVVPAVLATLTFVAAQISSWKETPFSVKVLSAIIDTTRNPYGGLFWLRYASSAGPTLTPLGTGLYLSVHNRRHLPTKVSDYVVELQAERKDWLKLHPVPLAAGTAFYAGNGLHHASQIDFSQNDLANTFQSRALKPDETVEGWIFLLPDYSYSCPPNGTRVRYRVTLVDSDSKEFAWTSAFDYVGKPPDPFFGPTQRGYLSVLPGAGHFDLITQRTAIRFWDVPSADPIWSDPKDGHNKAASV